MVKFQAHVLGSTPHRSLLLRRLMRCGFPAAEDLLKLAVKRGCTHYAPSNFDEAAVWDPGTEVISHEELGVGLISAAQVYQPQLIRCAVQLLSASDVNVTRLVHLARQERCLEILLHTARAAAGVGESAEPWSSLLSVKGDRMLEIADERLPHVDRFRLVAGRDRKGLQYPAQWLRRRIRKVPA